MQALADRLAAPGCKRRLQRQLEQLAGSAGRQQERLLTIEQLHFSCCYFAVVFASAVPRPSGEQLVEMQAAVASIAQAMRQLEPSNPKSHIEAVGALWLDTSVRQGKQAVKFQLHAFELAQQQCSDYWTIWSAATALTTAALQPLEVGHSGLAAALAACEQTAEAALRRCKRLLPEVWVRQLEGQMAVARPLLPGAHRQLQLLQQQASGSSPAARTALLASEASQAAVFSEQVAALRPLGRGIDLAHATDCDGCGQRAVGRRRCARCKRAQYCRYGCGRSPHVLLAGCAAAPADAVPVGRRLPVVGRTCFPLVALMCAPPPAWPPAAAGSARWRTGPPTSASAALPEAWAGQSGAARILLLAARAACRRGGWQQANKGLTSAGGAKPISASGCGRGQAHSCARRLKGLAFSLSCPTTLCCLAPKGRSVQAHQQRSHPHTRHNKRPTLLSRLLAACVEGSPVPESQHRLLLCCVRCRPVYQWQQQLWRPPLTSQSPQPRTTERSRRPSERLWVL